MELHDAALACAKYLIDLAGEYCVMEYLTCCVGYDLTVEIDSLSTSQEIGLVFVSSSCSISVLDWYVFSVHYTSMSR